MTLIRQQLFPRLGLNVKIMLTLSLILLGFALVSGGTFALIQGRDIKRHLMDQGKLMATMLSGSLQSGLFFENSSGIDQAVTSLLGRNLHKDLQAVSVYDAKQTMILHKLTKTQETPGTTKRLAGLMANALAAFQQNPERGTVWEGDDLLIFTTSVTVATADARPESLYFDTGSETKPPTLVGYAQLAVGRSQYFGEIRAIVLQTGVLTLVFLLVALIATYRLTRETMLPLKRLIDAIRSRGGQENQTAPDEVGFLGDTFSRLVRDLEEAFNTIQGLKDGLEDTVAERTQELRKALAELQETHLQLTQTAKMAAIGRLVAGVAHEINNTTNFISGSLPPLQRRLDELEEILRERGEKDASAEDQRCEALFKKISLLLANISEGARRTSKIVGDLRNYSRPADENMGLVDINQCIQSTCSLASGECKHRIELTQDLATNLPLMEGSQGRLNQVFMNLLLNAIQAQPEQGSILVRSWVTADKVHILFRDSGPGIPPEVMDRIFEPFFTTKERGQGSGQGLSISYSIIRKHQGEIQVRSEVGQGAEFEIILPLKQLPGAEERSGPQ
ncbi:MAG: hypothetical protein BWK76_13325 [Desulfobulbaceae bacterium A2]|nr:MAG: hypothetical protein BWK76_13325 [Desulfobulbaceae bacterium A2]